ncbi:MAG: hypothetical protein M1828_003063 [Chrysothrix sp. TS-e1954]|nr:MAG: hypothetical protein M1828_003063 [Chrysothrix sp. TS-e1954]
MALAAPLSHSERSKGASAAGSRPNSHGLDGQKQSAQLRKPLPHLPTTLHASDSSPNNGASTPSREGHSGPDSTSSQRSSTVDNGDEGPSYDIYRPGNLSRAGSVYSLSRVSFSNQIFQLTSIKLPDASSLAESISDIPSSTQAARKLGDAADQIQTWVQKSSDVLDGLDAGDDVEWAAAAGRDGLGEVDGAIARFESLVQVYVDAVEKLQLRPDASSVSSKDMSKVVTQVERVAKDWQTVKRSLTSVKRQVELAMEWEELRNSVFEDIGSELEILSRQVFEMEERRHRAEPLTEPNEAFGGIDIGELETILEDVPGNGNRTARLSKYTLPPQPFPQTSPLQSPNPVIAQDDTSLLGLFARMQPLRASLDFLPIKLSTLGNHARKTFPSACQELEDRRTSLEMQWTRLEGDAESLRKELGEDRWVLVFRNAGKQALRMIDSVERSISKLDESLDSNTQLKHAPSTMKKLESYEAKKMHYYPAIERVLGIVERGVKDRLTVNGEILRLQGDVQQRWRATKEDIKNMDSTLEFYENLKTQQLRDSVSSVLSSEKSLFSATMDTPGSSPASSVRTTSRRTSQHEPVTPYPNGRPRRDTSTSSNHSRVRTPVSNRHSSLPVPSPASSKLPIKTPLTRSSAHQAPRSVSTPSQRLASPVSTPSSKPSPQQLPTPAKSDRPRWNTSTSMTNSPIGHNFRPLAVTTPSPYAKTPPQRHYTPPSRRAPSSAAHYKTPTTNSPLSRKTSTEPPSPATPHFSRRAVSHQVSRSSNTQATAGSQYSQPDSRPSTSFTSSIAKRNGQTSTSRSRVDSSSVAGDSPALTPLDSLAASRRQSHISAVSGISGVED